MSATNSVPVGERKPERAEDLIAGLSASPYPNAPPGFVIRLVIALRRFLQSLADRVVPAHVALFELATGMASTQLLGAVARHRVADLLASGPLTADEIAARIGTHAETTHRCLRALATQGVFTLDGEGRFANNRLSRALVSGRLDRTRQFIEYFASGSNCAAWCDVERTLATGKNAFERVHGQSVWEWFDRHPEERETFAQSMMGMTVSDAPVVAAIYPFQEIRRLCDVGGGRGTLLSELLIRHPHLEGVLCDGPGVIELARPLLERRGVAGRVQTVPGNFFEEVPIGCDAYVMKSILHDWDDARSRQILARVRRAMQPGHKLLLVESLLEKNATAFAALADVQMMMVCSDGRERSRGEFGRLLESCGYRLGRVYETPTVSVIEGVAV
jgi:hypothetical protein